MAHSGNVGSKNAAAMPLRLDSQVSNSKTSGVDDDALGDLCKDLEQEHNTGTPSRSVADNSANNNNHNNAMKQLLSTSVFGGAGGVQGR